MSGLAQSLEAAVVRGLERHAEQQAKAQRRLSARRAAAAAADPNVTIMFENFARKVREHGLQAIACQRAGDHAGALAAARAAQDAADNAERLREALT